MNYFDAVALINIYSVHLETQFWGYIFVPCQPLLRVPKQGLTGGRPKEPSKANAIQKE